MTYLNGPRFQLLHEPAVDGHGELIAWVDDTPVTAHLSGALTRLMLVMIQAQDEDACDPDDIRGLRRYGDIAKAYADLTGYTVPPQGRAMAKSMVRIQEKFAAAWAAVFPGRKPLDVFDRRGARGARLEHETERRCRGYGAA